MTLAKTLLAGAAVCALCTAPALALAAPHIHLVGDDNIAKVKPGSVHIKTGQVHNDLETLTETITFSASFPPLKTKTLLWGETWQDTESCTPPKHESGMFPKKTKVAKISVGTSTGPTSACPSSTFTFYGPVYDLKKTAKSDSFSGSIVAKKYSGYNLTLNANTNLF
jgi:opacity protein-like surface antigen